MIIWPHLEEVISDKTQSLFLIRERVALSGGDISNAYKISDGQVMYFVKTNRKSQAFMFEAEAESLNALQQCKDIIVPEVVALGSYGSDSYIVLSYIDIEGKPKSSLFGEKLAKLHQVTHQQFGFHIDNSIGYTPQLNSWNEDWIEFWQKQRLGYQIELSLKNGLSRKLYDHGLKLIEKTPYFFQSYQPKISLLHGDLWSGNWSATPHGEPVIYDPACYYGDHEVDLAMTELFGHPGIHFLDSYKEHYPIDDGYPVRKLFYNLYHILNHANLFGQGYEKQAINMIDQLLVE